MNTTIPNPNDFIFKDEPPVETIGNNTPDTDATPKTECNPVDLPWDTFTIGGHNVVDLLVANISELINNSVNAFKKDGEINFTFGDLYKVIDKLHDEYGYDADNSEEMFCAVDKFGYGYKQYLVECALDKFADAGWDVDVTYKEFYSKDKAEETVRTAYETIEKVPFFGLFLNKEDKDEFDALVDNVWVTNNLLLSNENIITISPDSDDDDDYTHIDDETDEEDAPIEPVKPAVDADDGNTDVTHKLADLDKLKSELEENISKNEAFLADEEEIEAIKKDKNYKKLRNNLIDELVNEFASLFDVIDTDKTKGN